MTAPERFTELPLAAISDALDLVGFPGQCEGIRPLDPSFRLVGECFTVEYAPIEQASKDHTVGDYIDDVPSGAVIVINNQGRTDCTVWGDLLTLVAKRRGIAGTVIDGVARDFRFSTELNYPLFSLGIYMRTGKGRVGLRAVQEPTIFRGVEISPGDIVVGDADGIVVVPNHLRQEVLDLARKVEETEDRIRHAIISGGRLATARSRFGYHSLAAGRGRVDEN